jgi:cellulose synthase/poly-beta-1,6-N-acetylglucosamine synthase-like glycosyltransferase
MRGLLEAQYKWLLFCDDDNHLFDDYLVNAWKILENNDKKMKKSNKKVEDQNKSIEKCFSKIR